MNGDIFGFEIVPDQMQVVNPVIVLLLIPIFDKLIYPTLDACGGYLVCPLRRMIYGGFIAGFAFIASGILELKLEVCPKQELDPIICKQSQSWKILESRYCFWLLVYEPVPE